MRFKTYTLDEAIAKNRAMMNNIGELSWNQREYRTLLMIKSRSKRSPNRQRRKPGFEVKTGRCER